MLMVIFAIISIAESSYLWDTYFNREDEDALLCYNRPDGKYALPDSFRYLKCTNGAARIYECGNGEIFVPTCKKCLAQIHAQRGSFCNGRIGISSTGKVIKYQNPWDCDAWLECKNGLPTEHLCDSGLQFSSKKQRCVMDAKECKLAHQTAHHSNGLFLGRPKRIDAALLCADGGVILIKDYNLYKYPSKNKALTIGYPLTLYYRDLSEVLSSVDASLRMPDEKVYFFKGAKVWLWGSDESPRLIKDEWKGVPNNIDAAFYWQDNKKVYFFKKEYFYRFDPASRSVESGYPKVIAKGWPGASASIDAAVSLENGTVYLFKDHNVLTFHPPICKIVKSFVRETQYSTFSNINEK